ncbi:hypothetical protein GCM10010960_18100 [Arenimonas maotaiensis]|uniref:Uncharacterized protein n=1 Tax=Arenimonas maotaiensis TaxID=1446479 RepID=A0A917CS18_9GAMM|nr:hypothetical protein [Arenimonas maotaiensis]GGF96831.1 hypothetical protein GCM10010960_18100 [Arenimonas maotaiensis]
MRQKKFCQLLGEAIVRLENLRLRLLDIKFKLPGAPAFLMTNAPQRKEAFIRFIFVVLFSISPFVLIVALDFISMDKQGIWYSVSKYTDAGQIYFLIGAILGAAFILVRDNFREDHRRVNSNSLTNGEIRMRTERTWFSLYLYVVPVVSAIILCVYHLKQTKNVDLIYWSSSIIYVISLYVWFVDILYSRIGIDEVSEDGDSSQENESLEGSSGHSSDQNEMISKISSSLSAMNDGGDL